MNLRFKVTNKSKEQMFCLCCYKPIKREQESFYDGEDWWHNTCWKNYFDKMRRIRNRKSW